MPAVEFDREQLLTLIRHDCEIFMGFYLTDQLTLEVPEFHKELWHEFLDLLEEVNDPSRLVGKLQKLLGVPREHAKTTLTKLAVILFFRYSRLSFCAYVSNTFSSANNALKDIRDWLILPQESELYGKADIEKSSETEGLYIMQICIPNQLTKKTIIMKAFGQGTQLRGTLIKNKRPDIMIFDDVESLDTNSSEEQQKKLDAWCMGTAFKAMASYGVIVFIGNMISETTLLARLSKVEAWRPTVFGAIIRHNGVLQPLWPGRWTLEALLSDYASYRVVGTGHVWEAEMMNLTAKEILGESLITAIRPPLPMPDEVGAGFICLDPAFGVNAWNDESAITVHVRLTDGDIPILVESRHGRWKEEQLLDELISCSYYWGLTTWVIEAQAAQKLLISLFRLMLTQRQLSPDLFLMIPLMAAKDSKASRIVAFRSSVISGSYAIAESLQDFVIKLEGYSADSKVHDDELDSGSYGTVCWNLYGEVIKGKGRQDVAGLIMGDPMLGHNSGNFTEAEMAIP